MGCTSCGQGNNQGSSSNSGCCDLRAMDVVTPLEDIRNGDENFCFSEITDKICENLQNDEGINPSAKHSNTDCDDLTSLNDLATGSLHNALMTLNLCDVDAYKCWLDSLLSWQWNVDKAIICALCGAWQEAKKKTTVSAGNNITITTSKNSTGGTDYKVSTHYANDGETVSVRKLLKNDGSQYGYGDTMVLPADVSNYATIEIDYAVGNSQYSSNIPLAILTRTDVCPTLSGILYDGATTSANSIYIHLDGTKLRVGSTGQTKTGAQSVNINNGTVLNNGSVTKAMISIQGVYGLKDVKL